MEKSFQMELILKPEYGIVTLMPMLKKTSLPALVNALPCEQF